jgi:hypothetical protein
MVDWQYQKDAAAAVCDLRGVSELTNHIVLQPPVSDPAATGRDSEDVEYGRRRDVAAS